MGASEKKRAAYHPLDDRDKTIGTRGPHPIEKFTAPPETVREHLDRIGVAFKVPMVNGRLVIEIDAAELEAAENPKEGQQ
ncbi:hypothetical protein SEA_XENIA2_83 [Gordonia phage Xenia2]